MAPSSSKEKKLNQQYEDLHQKLDSEITYRRAQEFGESKKRKNTDSLEVANKKLKCENEELKKKLRAKRNKARFGNERAKGEEKVIRSVFCKKKYICKKNLSE